MIRCAVAAVVMSILASLPRRRSDSFAGRYNCLRSRFNRDHYARVAQMWEEISPQPTEITMKSMKLTLAALVLGALALPVLAQTTPPRDPAATPGIDQRQANQERRIQQGVKSGQLTDREAARLEKRQAKIEADKQAAKADGKVTPQERKQLQREQNQASRGIARQKHDAQRK